MKKPKVLIISDYAYPAGGIEVFIDELIKTTKEVINYRVLTWQPSEDTQKRVEISVTHRINCGDVAQSWKELEWADLLFFQTSWNVRLLGLLVRDFRKNYNKPLVTVVHTTSNSNTNSGASKFQQILLREIILISSRVVGVSQDVLDSLRSLETDGFESDKFHRIENASRFHPISNKIKERKCVSFIGRPMHSKGIDVFLDLAARLEDTDIIFRVNTVSMPPSEEITKKARNIAEYKWLLSDDEMRDFYDSTDLLIIPYRNSNGLPLTILEALACGVPIIGSESPGVTEILHRHNQLVLKPESISELVSAVRSWHKGSISIKMPETLSISTWKEQAMEYVKLFEEILSE